MALAYSLIKSLRKGRAKWKFESIFRSFSFVFLQIKLTKYDEVLGSLLFENKDKLFWSIAVNKWKKNFLEFFLGKHFRTDCFFSSGIMGGEYYNHYGGGANYLCLPDKPKYGYHKSGYQDSGRMCGTEYEVSSVNPFKKNLHDHDAPCVVCYVSSRGSMLMMPARNDCPSGWREEYHGYLMTAHYNHKNQKDFICVDEDSEYVPGSGASRNGALLYVVEGACGSLPCLPYVAGRELTCAVCTK